MTEIEQVEIEATGTNSGPSIVIQRNISLNRMKMKRGISVKRTPDLDLPSPDTLTPGPQVRSRSHSPNNRDISTSSDYAQYVESQHSQSMAALQAQAKTLSTQLVTKERSLRDSAATQLLLEERITELEHLVGGARESNKDLIERVRKLNLDKEEGIKDRKAMVMEDARKSVLIRRLQDDLEKANQGFKALVDNLIAEKSKDSSQNTSADEEKANLERMIEKLRDENKSLLLQNQSLKEENERNEQSLQQILILNDGPTESAVTTTSQGLRRALTVSNPSSVFPKRSSSAISLIDTLPNDGNLEIQMLKQRAISKMVSELQRLKTENQALIEQFAATLDRVTLLSS